MVELAKNFWLALETTVALVENDATGTTSLVASATIDAETVIPNPGLVTNNASAIKVRPTEATSVVGRCVLIAAAEEVQNAFMSILAGGICVKLVNVYGFTATVAVQD
jgi:hypothetical protein